MVSTLRGCADIERNYLGHSTIGGCGGLVRSDF